MLKGEAKKLYQREYMREYQRMKRSKLRSKHPSEVKPTEGPNLIAVELGGHTFYCEPNQPGKGS